MGQAEEIVDLLALYRTCHRSEPVAVVTTGRGTRPPARRDIRVCRLWGWSECSRFGYKDRDGCEGARWQPLTISVDLGDRD